MSLEVVRSGILDTVQDAGRQGYQHLGINVGGAMDNWAMQVANAVVGNPLDEGVIEMSFPAAFIKFHQSALISLAGAEFGAQINGAPITTGRQCRVREGSLLSFTKYQTGRFVYLAVAGGLQLTPWLGSVSTNLRVNAGGLARALRKGDVIQLRKSIDAPNELKISTWSVEPMRESRRTLRCMKGAEWSNLTEESQHVLLLEQFSVSPSSDRMGYRLQGPTLKANVTAEMLSTAVAYGTVQLLPNGQLIALMADRQTTGGYPRVLQVAAVDLPKLAQRNPHDVLQFEIIKIEEAQELLVNHHQQMRQIQMSCLAKHREFWA